MTVWLVQACSFNQPLKFTETPGCSCLPTSAASDTAPLTICMPWTVLLLRCFAEGCGNGIACNFADTCQVPVAYQGSCNASGMHVNNIATSDRIVPLVEGLYLDLLMHFDMRHVESKIVCLLSCRVHYALTSKHILYSYMTCSITAKIIRSTMRLKRSQDLTVSAMQMTVWLRYHAQCQIQTSASPPI